MFLAKTHGAPVKIAKEIPEEALRILKSGFFSYLGTSEAGCLPHLTAMFYVWHDPSKQIYMITTRGSRKISNIRKNTKVCVTVDERNAVLPAANRGVMIKGRAMMVEMELVEDNITVDFLAKYIDFLGAGYPIGNRIAIRVTPRILSYWRGTDFYRWKNPDY
jgi:nitroimidazol reductase NimA-like FMN-containing flavoprotein (pyridoxamine 5'-phosphate oxidase superfamily)